MWRIHPPVVLTLVGQGSAASEVAHEEVCAVLVALAFFPGVGVTDEEVGEAEWACCLGGGDKAVDGLGLSGEGVGGCSRPGGGQCDERVASG